MIFICELVPHVNYCQIASLMTQKSLFTITHALLYISSEFPSNWSCYETKIRTKLVSHFVDIISNRIELVILLITDVFATFHWFCPQVKPNQSIMIISCHFSKDTVLCVGLSYTALWPPTPTPTPPHTKKHITNLSLSILYSSFQCKILHND